MNTLKRIARATFDIFQVLLIVFSSLLVGYGYGVYTATIDRCKAHKKDSVCIVKYMGVAKQEEPQVKNIKSKPVKINKTKEK